VTTPPTPFYSTFGDYSLSTDPRNLDIDRVEAMLRASYWAAERPREVIEKTIAGSLCIGAYRRAGGLQVGFARLVTDYATFGWLCDVFVDPVARGQKLGVAMVEALVTLPEVRDLNLVLQTADAHKLYERFGFTPLWNPDRWMYKPKS
jgi:GNAT superfamily N-acetyltransferase